MEKKETDDEKRLKEGLRAAKTILVQKHSCGELHDIHDFNRCVKKGVIIGHIRENPTTYPHCAGTKTKSPESSSIADREPLLSRIFPDFTKHPEIKSEYERLINEK